MAKERKQLNLRVEDEDLERIARLLPAVKSALKISRINTSDLLRLGLVALEEKYLAEPEKKGKK